MSRGYEYYLGSFNNEPVDINGYIGSDLGQRYDCFVGLITKIDLDSYTGMYDVFTEVLNKDLKRDEYISSNLRKAVRNYIAYIYNPMYLEFE